MSQIPAHQLLAIIEMQNVIVRSAVGVEAVLAVVVDRAMALTGATGAVVELIEQATQGHRGDAAVACGSMAHHGASVTSVASVPVVHNSEPAGELKVVSDQPRAFNDVTTQILTLLAEVIAAGLQRVCEPGAELYDHKQRRPRSNSAAGKTTTRIRRPPR